MSSGRRRWSLGSLLLLLGRNLAVFVVHIHQESVTSTRGQSALLPVSYRFDGAPPFPVSIRWMVPNSSMPLIACTLLNCSLGARGVPSNCSAKLFPSSAYRGRAELFPENGSLLLRDLRLSDTGVYSVAFRPSYQTWNVTLTVHEPRPSPQHPGTPQPEPWVTGVCSSVPLLLLVLLSCCIWQHRGAAQRKKRRIIKQQQVSNGEESHMESTMVRDVATIYTSLGDSSGQPQPRLTPEAVYTTITSASPPGLDAGLYDFPM